MASSLGAVKLELCARTRSVPGASHSSPRHLCVLRDSALFMFLFPPSARLCSPVVPPGDACPLPAGQPVASPGHRPAAPGVAPEFACIILHRLEWRNWQTRETQNLVVLGTVGVQVPPPAPSSYELIVSFVSVWKRVEASIRLCQYCVCAALVLAACKPQN